MKYLQPTTPSLSARVHAISASGGAAGRGWSPRWARVPSRVGAGCRLRVSGGEAGQGTRHADDEGKKLRRTEGGSSEIDGEGGSEIVNAIAARGYRPGGVAVVGVGRGEGLRLQRKRHIQFTSTKNG
eukprot:CAMPEP_0174858050 /NCGR_PEP_ID=MMETSP1114-20130205/41208_1 /TAXON_ID=312471 /ORGANISM="Neobodo designis, Strain CCAP 1951/1" /LENGTH=126 /DNA_ID=CAMNT_0016092935 /DNA_START=157 /DNA_END=534 /DNA_ORIENTATION=+